MQSDGTTPLTDDNGYWMYTWIEEQRYIDGSGYPAWQDVTQNPRGSVQVSAGQYINLAHEANGLQAAANEHVTMWAGVCNVTGTGQNAVDYEHIFYNNNYFGDFELKGDITPGGSADAYPMKLDMSDAWTSQPTFTVYDTDGDCCARGRDFMTASHGARGHMWLNPNTLNWEIVSMQHQAGWISVSCYGCAANPFNPTAVTVLEPGGQDPSNGGSSLSSVSIARYSTAIGTSGQTTSGIVCLATGLGTYLTIDAPCPDSSCT
jgi:hypothetical protein